MISVTDAISLDEREIRLFFLRSSGPGGQNVNKVSTAVQLRFDVLRSPSLPDSVRRRLLALAGNRLTKEGVIVIEARRRRTQEQNRREALLRLIRLIRKAASEPKIRKQTSVPSRVRERRLEEKRRRSSIKKDRRPILPSED